jgi:formylglycine-generating enzyme required for sulfatase activity
MHYQSALKFVEWLSKKTGKKYRLPTEEEWQWAATAGEKPTVLSAKELGKVAWYWDNAGDKAMEVGKLLPNTWGFYDMLGNVAEWCQAPAGTPYNKEPARGGCWKDKVKDVQYTAVQFWQPDWQLADAQIPKSKWWLSDGPYVGIRVVCDAE